MVSTDYQIIKRHTIRVGKEVEVNKRAAQLQRELAEPGCPVPYRDAYEMAYNEIVIDRISF